MLTLGAARTHSLEACLAVQLAVVRVTLLMKLRLRTTSNSHGLHALLAAGMARFIWIMDLDTRGVTADTDCMVDCLVCTWYTLISASAM